MASILLIGPDPETREILKLRLEVDGYSVLTALGKNDAAPLIEHEKPAAVIIDMIGYNTDEQKEVFAITKNAHRLKVRSVLLLPRGNAAPAEPQANLVIKKPYDLNALIAQVRRLISSPKTSCSPRRGSRRRS